jgi:ABC-type phosphate transport system substrate-binding protein
MGRRLFSGRSLVALILALAALAACGEPVATPEPVYVRIAGSAAMAPVVDELVSAFTDANPTVSVEVTPYGSLFGLESLQAGEAELAMVSWLSRDAPGFGLLLGVACCWAPSIPNGQLRRSGAMP